MVFSGPFVITESHKDAVVPKSAKEFRVDNAISLFGAAHPDCTPGMRLYPVRGGIMAANDQVSSTGKTKASEPISKTDGITHNPLPDTEHATFINAQDAQSLYQELKTIADSYTEYRSRGLQAFANPATSNAFMRPIDGNTDMAQVIAALEKLAVWLGVVFEDASFLTIMHPIMGMRCDLTCFNILMVPNENFDHRSVADNKPLICSSVQVDTQKTSMPVAFLTSFRQYYGLKNQASVVIRQVMGARKGGARLDINASIVPLKLTLDGMDTETTKRNDRPKPVKGPKPERAKGKSLQVKRNARNTDNDAFTELAEGKEPSKTSSPPRKITISSPSVDKSNTNVAQLKAEPQSSSMTSPESELTQKPIIGESNTSLETHSGGQQLNQPAGPTESQPHSGKPSPKRNNPLTGPINLMNADGKEEW